MKLKYERFEDLGCLYIRGVVDANQLKMLILGLQNIIPHLEEPLAINLALATIGKIEAAALVEVKKKIQTRTQHKLYWLSKERPLGDFPTVDLLISRFPGSKFRHIGEKIKRDDEVYQLTDETAIAHARIIELGGDEQKAQQIIFENTMLKAQKKTLDEMLHWQKERTTHQTATVSEDPDLAERKKSLNKDLEKLAGGSIDL